MERDLTEQVTWLREDRYQDPVRDDDAVRAVRRAADTISLENLELETAAERLDVSPQLMVDILNLLGGDGFEDFYLRRVARSGFFIERIPDAED